jgi:hypothetical protein
MRFEGQNATMAAARGRVAARRRTPHHRRPARPALTSCAVEVVAIVPRTSGKIPRIAVRPVQPINLADGEWQKLEASLGKPIPQQARASIIVATNSFLQSAEAESNAGSMDDALERVERLRKCAQSFRAVIEERAVGRSDARLRRRNNGRGLCAPKQ